MRYGLRQYAIDMCEWVMLWCPAAACVCLKHSDDEGFLFFAVLACMMWAGKKFLTGGFLPGGER